ncbi:MAG: proline--tRNA ligase [Gammaproteobacteria bacterium]|nr:proline--tRNA ligase [Gammaproteobacteria bacterium]
MRQSQLLIPTLKEAPAGAEVASHQLMLRAGLVRQVAAGLYTWLPLGLRVIRRIEAIIREEMDRSGAQEVLMPVVQPAELWQESGRWEKMGPELARLADRHERDFCLGPTHEEVITDLFRREVHSYRQLPCNFYQIQTKFRDEVRPRFGVMRAREFTMKDAYSFAADQASFDATYREMHDCYSRILRRMQLDFRAVEADTGNIGGANSHEFHVLAESGEDTIAYASEGGYAANLERAVAAPPPPRPTPGETLREVATPGRTTIAEVAQFLEVPVGRCVKALAIGGEDGPMLLILRGDHELNAIKAQKLPGVKQPLEFASEADIRTATGAGPGSIGPVGAEVPVFVDREAAALADFVCGANRDGHHLVGVNWGRDLLLDEAQVGDLRNVAVGDPAPNDQGELQFLKGIEVGHIFQLGDTYSQAMGASFLDREGKASVPIMGCYGMGVTRLVAAVIEQHHDAAGLRWPEALAPFDVHLVALNYGKSESVREAADRLLAELSAAGIEALLDDRPERPGVKFADADLLGLPKRVVIGERGLKQGCVEVRAGHGRDLEQVAPAEVKARLC